jgi:hypothetical protein
MTTQIAIGFAANDGDRLLALQPGFVSETVASGDVSTAVAPASGGAPVLARIATNAAVYVAFGPAVADASAEPRILCPADTISYVYCTAGDKAAVDAVA